MLTNYWLAADEIPSKGKLILLTSIWLISTIAIILIVEIFLTGIMVLLGLAPASILSRPGNEVPTTGLILILVAIAYLIGFVAANITMS